jgi:hypothetical protein
MGKAATAIAAANGSNLVNSFSMDVPHSLDGFPMPLIENSSMGGLAHLIRRTTPERLASVVQCADAA